MEILVENVRCFSGMHRVPLRPLTLLVGENSSGKSSFLGVVSCVFDTKYPGCPDFNAAPFQLGNFETIVSNVGRNINTSNSFAFGFSHILQRETELRECLAAYSQVSGRIVLRKVQVTSSAGLLKMNVAKFGIRGSLKLQMKKGNYAEPIVFDHDFGASSPFFQEYASYLDVSALNQAIVNSLEREEQDQVRLQLQTFVLLDAINPRRAAVSIAPIRSRPKRTYDYLTEHFSPEGGHVPALLARMFREETDSQEFISVKKALSRFGEESGLFKNIHVRHLGKNVSDPFQIQVSIKGRRTNLVDVGYGVSQALPIVVQSVLRSNKAVLLLQQPEVHLHPRAQAALGSFFSDLAAKGDRMFLVETHSDHLVDRVRQEVASGNISPERVMILFFDKPRRETTVYPITLDKNGNVENAPESYRSFFLEETLNLLHRT